MISSSQFFDLGIQDVGLKIPNYKYQIQNLLSTRARLLLNVLSHMCSFISKICRVRDAVIVFGVYLSRVQLSLAKQLK